MKVTREVKDYIRKRVHQLTPTPVQQVVKDELIELAEAFAEELGKTVDELVTNETLRFVTEHPDAEGCVFHTARTYYSSKPSQCSVYFDMSGSKLQTELNQANSIRQDTVENLIEIATIDAVNCATAMDIDAMIMSLINR